MIDGFMIGVILMMVAILISRIVSEKALKKLNADQKTLLIDQFSSQRIWSLAMVILILVGYFLALKTRVLEPITMMTIYIVVLAVFMTIQIKSSISKLQRIEIGSAYIRSYKISAGIRTLGIAIFFVAMFIFK